MEPNNTDKEDYARLFAWIVWGFITGVISGVWAWFVLKMRNNVYFQNEQMAGIMVGMITVSISVIVVVFSSKLFKYWLKDKMDFSRAVKAKIRQERMNDMGVPQFITPPQTQVPVNPNIQPVVINQPQQTQPAQQQKDMTMQDGWDGKAK